MKKFEKVPSTLKEAESDLRYRRLLQALSENDGNMPAAARSLDISVATAYRIRSDGQRLRESVTV